MLTLTAPLSSCSAPVLELNLALAAASLAGQPVFAETGASPKQSYFGSGNTSPLFVASGTIISTSFYFHVLSLTVPFASHTSLLLGMSSPFAFDEKREDPMYSPYSPFGDGSAAVYKEAQAEEKVGPFEFVCSCIPMIHRLCLTLPC